MEIRSKIFEKAISEERFAVYIKKTRNREKALKLYTWNKVISGSFYCLLQDLEVVLRVAISKQLVQKYGTHWYNESKAGFNDYALRQINQAKNNVKRINNVSITKGQIPDKLAKNIVPELTFGFWAKLFGTGKEENSEKNFNYTETFWWPVLQPIFPAGKNRDEMYKIINELRMLRNKIAHHQAIFDYELEKKYQSILTLLGWLSPEMRDYSISTTRVPYLLENFDLKTFTVNLDWNKLRS